MAAETGAAGSKATSLSIGPAMAPTSALAVCFQDNQIVSDTRYSASQFKVAGGAELKLNRLFVSYANQSPSLDLG